MGKIVGLTFPQPVPTETEKCSCPVCGKEYKSQENLAKHIREKHPENAETQE